MTSRIDLANLRLRLKYFSSQSTKKIELLDAIRERADKKATPEEVETLNSFDIPALDSNLVSLMLEAKANKRATKTEQPSYKPFLIDMNTISPLVFQYKMSELIANKQPFHYDCIIKTDAHCSPLQLESDGEHLRVFYIDAAGDSRHSPFINSFSQYDNASIVKHEGHIQWDNSSCSIFSLQHLNNLSHTPLDKPDPENPGILSLSPLFLKNIQSTSSLRAYYLQHSDQTIDKKQKTTLKSHIETYSITVDVADSAGGMSQKTKNYSIAYKTDKYLKAALDALNDMEAKGIDVEQVIDARNSFGDKNILTPTIDHDARTRMFRSIIEKKDLKKIEEILCCVSSGSDNDRQLITDLIKQGADLNISFPAYKGSDRKTTPIAYAINLGDTELVKQLLDSCNYIDNKDSEGESFIAHFNSARGQLTVKELDILELLINHGANINQPSDAPFRQAKTLLFNALESNDSKDTIEKLISLGATVNARDNEGNTPLHCLGNDEAALALINAGAELNAINNQGQTPLERQLTIYSRSNRRYDYRKMEERERVMTRLIQHGATDDLFSAQGGELLEQVFANKSNEFFIDNAFFNTLFKAMSVNNLRHVIEKDPNLFYKLFTQNDVKKIAAILKDMPMEIQLNVLNSKNQQGRPIWAKILQNPELLATIPNSVLIEFDRSRISSRRCLPSILYALPTDRCVTLLNSVKETIKKREGVEILEQVMIRKSPEVRSAIYEVMKDEWPALIEFVRVEQDEDADEFGYDDFKLALEYLNPLQRTQVYDAIKDKIPAVLNTNYPLLDGEAIKYLTNEQQADILSINTLMTDLKLVASPERVTALASALMGDDPVKIHTQYAALIEHATGAAELNTALSNIDPVWSEKIKAAETNANKTLPISMIETQKDVKARLTKMKEDKAFSDHTSQTDNPNPKF